MQGRVAVTMNIAALTYTYSIILREREPRASLLDRSMANWIGGSGRNGSKVNFRDDDIGTRRKAAMVSKKGETCDVPRPRSTLNL